jgi:formylglycine-generating enzyme required for sulfatase activity
MISVTGGTFTAGSTVTTISSFSIDKYEVTYEKYTAVRQWGLVNGYTDMNAGTNGYNPAGSNNPVTTVSWYDVVKWCNARSEKEGLTPVYYTTSAKTTVYRTGEGSTYNLLPNCVEWTANGYRLPTEAEWEFAAKGGVSSKGYDYSGSNTVGDVAWWVNNSGTTTHTVGGKAANELGIYDMSGNAYEWCWDWYGSSYPSVGATDPQGPNSVLTYRVLRGGAFYYTDADCRSVYRNSYYGPINRNYTVGFRCAQD